MSLARACRSTLLLLLVASSSGCLCSRVKWVEPDYAVPMSVESIPCGDKLARAEKLYASAVEREENCCERCVDLYYQVAALTHDDTCPPRRECRKGHLHKSSLAKLVVTGKRFKRLDPSTGLTVHYDDRTETVPVDYRGFVWRPSDFHCLIPVGKYKTRVVNNIHRCDGVGVPLVVSSCRPEDDPSFLPPRVDFAATLVMSGDSCGDQPACETCCNHGIRLQLYDPLRVCCAMKGGKRRKIASDLTAPLAYRIRNEQRNYLTQFLNPEGEGSEAGLYLLEPYQRGKIPVVFSHGLLSDPFTWIEIVNELRAEPGFIEHFQIWVFEYPTGRQFLSSAQQLREQLRVAVRSFDPLGHDPQLSNMVLVGHSMGGLVSKLQVTSSGNALWRSIANKPFNQVRMRSDQRSELAPLFFFEPSRNVTRVVYMATPHRGSTQAARLLGRLGSALVTQTEERVEDHRQLLAWNPGVFSEEVTDRIPTSIDLLSPESELLKAIERMPVVPGVCLHSIIGNHCRTIKLKQSDGVVEVSSAHQCEAKTEFLVKATHSEVHDHPKAVAELIRILGEHLECSNKLEFQSAFATDETLALRLPEELDATTDAQR